MRVVSLEKERVSDFVGYCKKHRSEVDDSSRPRLRKKPAESFFKAPRKKAITAPSLV
ncbi:hypothetical protein ABLO26_06760 [Neobacillus sp. 179-J 1A1 HS]|uniref:hypothetical protein n=1 Tax=Neobacillus driksii TaxID=3035913 RepID=UPI0035BBBAC8